MLLFKLKNPKALTTSGQNVLYVSERAREAWGTASKINGNRRGTEIAEIRRENNCLLIKGLQDSSFSALPLRALRLCGFLLVASIFMRHRVRQRRMRDFI